MWLLQIHDIELSRGSKPSKMINVYETEEKNWLLSIVAGVCCFVYMSFITGLVADLSVMLCINKSKNFKPRTKYA